MNVTARMPFILCCLLGTFPACAHAEDPPAHKVGGATAVVGLTHLPFAAFHQTAGMFADGWLHFPEAPPTILRGSVRVPVAAAMTVLAGGPLQTPIMLQCGENTDCWSLEDSRAARWLDRFAASALRDEQPLPGPADQTPEGVQEYFVYQDALLKLWRAPREDFERVALSNLDLDQLDSRPHTYRGQIVRIHARPKRVRTIDAPERLKDLGIPQLYQIWALANTKGVARPVCLISPWLPHGVKVGDDQADDVELAMSGYFLKRLKVDAQGGVPGYRVPNVPLLLGSAYPLTSQQARLAAAAATVAATPVSASHPHFSEIALLSAGDRAHCWTIKDESVAPLLERSDLEAVTDGTGMPRGYEDNDTLTRETFAYIDAIAKANTTGIGPFLQSVNPEITFFNLHNDPKSYRGKVVRIEGYLRRVLRHEPYLYEREAGVKDVFELWLVNDKHGKNNPAVLLCTQLPEGITVDERMHGKSVQVAFIGYFFKKYRFDADDKSQYDVPMLIGFLELVPKQKKPANDNSTGMVTIFLGVIAGTIALIFLVTWIFRKADRNVRARISAMAPPFAGASEPEPAEPISPESEPPLAGERRM